MRNGLALVLVLAACGGGGTTPPGGDDVQPPGDGSDQPPPPGAAFVITSADVQLVAGQEITRCFFFRTPNTETLVIKRWTSEMTPGSHHMIVFTTGDKDVGTPGTLSDNDCGGVGNVDPSGGVPSWTYAAQTPIAELTLPADDGTGKPLGQEIPANTAGFIQMHYLNATDKPITAHVQLVAYAYDPGTAFTKTAPYVTYDPNITIQANEIGHVQTTSCNTPSGAKFWLMSTHAHKQAVHTEVRDGTTVMVSSNDWEHPAVADFDSSPFFTFATGKLTWSCTYDNTGDNATRVISDGPSAATDEMCMASGYYFPATKALFCYGSVGPF
jgi:copper type II ascorbate-dependent monooxygenase-like protein